MLKKILLCFFVMLSTTLIGCPSKKVFYQTEGNVADVVCRAGAARHKSDLDARPRPTLVVNKGSYVDRTPISLEKSPAWLNNHIIIKGDELPFAYYARAIANAGGQRVLTRYQTGLDSTLRVTMNYSGSVRGALNLLASKTNYVFNICCSNIYWQAFITRTFDIAFMPGSSDYLMGKATGGSGGTVAQVGGANTVTAMIDDSAAQQYSNLKATLSIWKDLESTIKQMLSPDGKVVVSEATTTVTVRDRPNNVEVIGKYICNLNHAISRQVLVKIQILDVQLSSDFDLGIDWTIIQRAFGGSNFIFNAAAGEPISITSLNTSPFGVGIPNIGLSIIPGRSTGYTALINALTQQGKVSVVEEPRVVALNNQVSVVRIINQEGYLASVQNTTVAGTGGTGSTVTSQITPGTLVTGLTLYILPKIMGCRIYLQVNADISNRVSITKVTATNDTAAPAIPVAAIQVPNLTQKQFNQRAVIGSGDTLILSGFRRIANNTGAMQVLGSQALGGRGSNQLNTETVILITPIILPGYA